MKRTLNLKTQARNLFTVMCAVLMLGSFVLLSPWVNISRDQILAAFSVQGGTLPQGVTPPSDAIDSTSSSDTSAFAPPAGFEAPASTTNTTTTDSFTPPAGFQGGGLAGGLLGGAPGSTGRFLVPFAAVMALVFTGFGIWKPNRRRAASGLTLVMGLLALVYYVIFFVIDAIIPIPINFVSLAQPGFWVALVGSIGLFLQVFIPRFEQDESQTVVKALVPKAKRSGLSLAQNLRVAMDALLANKLRSALTMLGIIIGVASVVSMVSVGRGASAAVTEQISSTGLNLLTINSGSGIAIGPGAGGGNRNVQTLTFTDAEALSKQLTGIDTVLPQYTSNLEIRSDQEQVQTSVRGVSPLYATTRHIDIEIGRYITEAEYNNRARVVVLGQGAAEELFGGLNPVGRDIRIENKRFEVIGVLAEQDGGFGQDPNLEVHIPLTTGYRQLFSNARKTGSSEYNVSSIIVAVTNLDDVEQISTDIETVLRKEHKLKADEDNDFSILDQQTLLDTASTITGIMTVLLGAIASVSLLVGGIGIMNIMLVSVSERTKEIGLRKAIGARRGHISQQFLIETIFLSMLGGSLGVLLGIGIALLVNASGVLTAEVSLDSVALGLGFSAIVGIFFGVYPANRAAALEPIEALRYE